MRSRWGDTQLGVVGVPGAHESSEDPGVGGASAGAHVGRLVGAAGASVGRSVGAVGAATGAHEGRLVGAGPGPIDAPEGLAGAADAELVEKLNAGVGNEGLASLPNWTSLKYILRQPTQILARLVGVAVVVEVGLVVVVVEAGCSWRIGSRFVAVVEAWARGGSCETERGYVSERLVRPSCLRRATTVPSTCGDRESERR
ncbi:hypothetical protein RIF29_11155 [Crotalaria pallida]|uniref:Uncharacterized protein n=1 Tax=Crotalaria pallida TaxID=3830 RepID=A0AAN9ILV7_CROPI